MQISADSEELQQFDFLGSFLKKSNPFMRSFKGAPNNSLSKIGFYYRYNFFIIENALFIIEHKKGLS